MSPHWIWLLVGLAAPLAGIGFYTTALAPDTQRLPSPVADDQSGGTPRSPPPLNPAEPAGSPALAASAPDLAALSAKIDALAGHVAALQEGLSQIREDRASVPNPAFIDADGSPPPTPPQTQVFDAYTELSGLLEHERRVGESSPWAQQAQTAMVTAFEAKRATSPFFAAYGGDLATDCAASVCAVRWAPEAGTVIDPESRATLLETARWELLSVIGPAGAAGEFAIEVDEHRDEPEFTIVFSAGTGGDLPPDQMK